MADILPEIREKRLKQKDSTVSGASVAKVFQEVRSLADAVLTRPASASGKGQLATDAIVRLRAEEAVRQLEVCAQSTLSKARSIEQVTNEDIQEYERQRAKVAQRSAAARADIARLEQELRQQRAIRSHKEEYDRICGQLNKLPAQRVTAAEVARLEAALQASCAEEARVAAMLAVREKQFKLLLHNVFDLQATIVEEDAEAAMDEAAAAIAAAEAAQHQEPENAAADAADDDEDSTSRKRRRGDDDGDDVAPAARGGEEEEEEVEDGETEEGSGGGAKENGGGGGSAAGCSSGAAGGRGSSSGAADGGGGAAMASGGGLKEAGEVEEGKVPTAGSAAAVDVEVKGRSIE